MSARNIRAKKNTARCLWKASSGRCVYCGLYTTPHLRTRDHMIPVSLVGGGSKALLLPACKPCNGAKGDRLVSPLDICHPDFRGYVESKLASLRNHLRNRGIDCPDYLKTS